MRTRIAILGVVLALGSALFAGPAGASSTRTVTKSYQLGAVGDIDVVCATDPDTGGTCFGLNIGEAKVTITVNDDAGWSVAVGYFFTDPLRRGYGSGDFCQTATLNIPVGAGELDIYTEFVLPVPLAECGLSQRPATSGTITAEFYTPWP